jgi:hypothetical protein
MKKLHTLAALAALAVAAPVLADDRGVPGVDVDITAGTSVSMPSMDKNSDGKVSRSEAASNKELSQQFDQLDRNKDGNLDKGEFAKFEGKAKGSAKGTKRGTDDGEPANPNNVPGTTDDSTPGNPDQLGPGR